jgi:multidrug transporter EmrE-like cation transporter
MKWLILIAGIFCNASASVLVKLAMLPPRQFPSMSDPMAAVRNWPFWLGIVLYGGAFLLYAAALAKLPLNVAHPVLTSGAIAAVALCSALIFKESFSTPMIVGFVLIIAGVALITTSGA